MALPNILISDNYSKKGFTLLEILVVFGILMILTSFGLFLSMDFFRGYTFNYEKNILIGVLQKARSESMANINQAPHGFYWDGDNYIIFQGEDYSTRDASFDEVFPASKNISISGVPSAGVVFEQLSGDSSPFDIIISDNIKSATISINKEGRINW